MTKGVKIGLISFGVVGLGVGTYFLFQYMKLKKAYSTTLSPIDATALIDKKTSGVPDAIIPDEITANADAQKGIVVEDDSMTSDNNYSDLQLFDIQSGMGDY